MKGHIGIVQIEHPGGTEEDEAAGGYWEAGRGSRLLAMYGELLGMEHIYIGYHKLGYRDGRIPEIGFEHARGNATPEWQNPDRPQQVHLDIEVPDIAAGTDLALSNGAPLLDNRDGRVVLADPVGHPFCLYPAPLAESAHGRIKRIVSRLLQPPGSGLVLRTASRHA